MPDQEAEILVAATSAVIEDENGVRRTLVKGKTTAHSRHPIVKGREHLFKPLAIDFDVPVMAGKSRS